MDTHTQQRDHFLDGLRGVAALFVALYHFTQHTAVTLAPQAFVLVDFFFILSGFVLSRSYGAKIAQGWTFGKFMARRFARLYPMYGLGLVVGFSVLFLEIATGKSTLTVPQAMLSLVLNAVYLPFPNGGETAIFSGSVPGEVFPGNGPSWSLFFEMAVNALFFGIVVQGRPPARLLAVAAYPIVVLLILKDLGSSGWGTENVAFGFPRVLYGFFAGVAMQELAHSDLARRWRPTIVRHSQMTAVAIVAMVVAIVAVPLGGLAQHLWLVIAVTIAPLLVLVGSMVRLRGPAMRAATWLGAISYPLYCLHHPLVRTCDLVATALGVRDAGLSFILPGFIACIALSWAAALLVDEPLSRWLARAVHGDVANQRLVSFNSMRRLRRRLSSEVPSSSGANSP